MQTFHRVCKHVQSHLSLLSGFYFDSVWHAKYFYLFYIEFHQKYICFILLYV